LKKQKKDGRHLWTPPSAAGLHSDKATLTLVTVAVTVIVAIAIVAVAIVVVVAVASL
jgi:hypothetical protein